jgi:hypothetical protein
MNIIVCVDDHGGTMFNHRRQSQDRVLRADVLHEAEDHTLWMNEYSAKQFDTNDRFNVAEDFLLQSGPDDYCFVEGEPIAAYESAVSTLILYKWNRAYPADTFFDIPLVEHGWTLVDRVEFTGHSHEKITKELYQR